MFTFIILYWGLHYLVVKLFLKCASPPCPQGVLYGKRVFQVYLSNVVWLILFEIRDIVLVRMSHTAFLMDCLVGPTQDHFNLVEVEH